MLVSYNYRTPCAMHICHSCAMHICHSVLHPRLVLMLCFNLGSIQINQYQWIEEDINITSVVVAGTERLADALVNINVRSMSYASVTIGKNRISLIA